MPTPSSSDNSRHLPLGGDNDNTEQSPHPTTQQFEHLFSSHNVHEEPVRSAGRHKNILPRTRAERRRCAPAHSFRPRKTHKRAWIITAVLTGIFILTGSSLAFIIADPLGGFAFQTDYTGTGDNDVIIMIHEGDTGEDIARTLASYSVTKDVSSFYKLLLTEPESPVFYPGTYRLKAHMSAVAALTALRNPSNRVDHTVIIPEGTIAATVYQSLSEGTGIPVEEYHAAASDIASFGLPPEAQSLEGFLFPDAYSFTPNTTAKDVLHTLVNRQLAVLDEHHVSVEDRWKTIVLSSVIEREAGLADDFYKVSRVFHNRIAQQWNLQSDATVTYYTQQTHRATTTDAERGDPSNPYNTYIRPGLPAGPISNPGKLAIDAALHPAEGSWMFFVTWNLDTGETVFSTTPEEHNKAVSQWEKWMNEHPGYG